MAKAVMGVVIVLLILVGVGIYFMMNSGDSSDDINPNTNEVNENVNEMDDSMNSGMQEMKTFILTGENFKFMKDGKDNPVIMVNEGDKVRIEFTSVGGMHDWKLDEFNAATEIVRDGEGMTFVEFVADKKGTFEYYCSVGQHRANGMKGMFIVE